MEEKEHLKFENEELFEKILRLEQQLNEEESAKEVWKAGVVVEKRNCELKVQSCYESTCKSGTKLGIVYIDYIIT